MFTFWLKRKLCAHRTNTANNCRNRRIATAAAIDDGPSRIGPIAHTVKYDNCNHLVYNDDDDDDEYERDMLSHHQMSDYVN